MNDQIEAIYDGQATYPDAPVKLEAAPQTKAAPVKLIRKQPILTPTDPQKTPTIPATLSESLDHYLYW
jgi:hypothetical protein